MKSISYLFTFAIAIEASTALLGFPNLPKTASRFLAQEQKPIMNIPNIPLPGSNSKDSPSSGSGDVIISDVIGKERIINIFAGFTSMLSAPTAAHDHRLIKEQEISTASLNA